MVRGFKTDKFVVRQRGIMIKKITKIMENKKLVGSNNSPNLTTSNSSTTLGTGLNYYHHNYSYPNNIPITYLEFTGLPYYYPIPCVTIQAFQPLVQLVNSPSIMNYQRTILNKFPEAFITVNKSRTKIFGNNVYLSDETDFEIELFNPSNETLGVKFMVNGKYISDNHFVLYPGKRFVLDRYLNDNKKFKYITYTIDDTIESKGAVVNNGLIQVEFYREYQPLSHLNILDTIHRTNFNMNIGTTDGTTNGTTNVTNTVNNNNTYTTNTGTVNGITGPIIDNGCPNTLTNVSLSYSEYNSVITPDCVDTTGSGGFVEIETGMVVIGEESKTLFGSADIQFDYFSVSIKTFKILPLSQKPIVAKDLIPLCKKCKTKGKKNHKFCVNCGTKL